MIDSFGMGKCSNCFSQCITVGTAENVGNSCLPGGATGCKSRPSSSTKTLLGGNGRLSGSTTLETDSGVGFALGTTAEEETTSLGFGEFEGFS